MEQAFDGNDYYSSDSRIDRLEQSLSELEKKVQDLEVIFRELNNVMSTFIRTELEVLSNRFGDKKE